MAILPNGNVGIGTTSPGLKLDVNGIFRSNGMAKEVKSNGVDLGEMNKILLEKVEELSLYIISLKKQLDAQQAQITALQRQL